MSENRPILLGEQSWAEIVERTWNRSAPRSTPTRGAVTAALDESLAMSAPPSPLPDPPGP